LIILIDHFIDVITCNVECKEWKLLFASQDSRHLGSNILLSILFHVEGKIKCLVCSRPQPATLLRSLPIRSSVCWGLWQPDRIWTHTVQGTSPIIP